MSNNSSNKEYHECDAAVAVAKFHVVFKHMQDLKISF